MGGVVRRRVAAAEVKRMRHYVPASHTSHMRSRVDWAEKLRRQEPRVAKLLSGNRGRRVNNRKCLGKVPKYI